MQSRAGGGHCAGDLAVGRESGAPTGGRPLCRGPGRRAIVGCNRRWPAAVKKCSRHVKQKRRHAGGWNDRAPVLVTLNLTEMGREETFISFFLSFLILMRRGADQIWQTQPSTPACRILGSPPAYGLPPYALHARALSSPSTYGSLQLATRRLSFSCLPAKSIDDPNKLAEAGRRVNRRPHPHHGRPLRLAPPGWPRTAQSTPAGDRCVSLLSRCRQMRIRAGGWVFLPDGEILLRPPEAVNQSRRHARLPLSLVRRQLHRPCAGRPAATSANSPVVRVQRRARSKVICRGLHLKQTHAPCP